MYDSDRKIAREALFKAIRIQMKEGNPPETTETFRRLMSEGYSRKESMKLIACVLLVEINEMVKENRLYNEATYVKALKALPRLPWEDEPED
ncbi:MAG: hypothetical protein ABIG94_08385 [Pseudomonadota bacterium]